MRWWERKIIPLRYLIAGISLIICVSVAAVLAGGLAVYSRRAVVAHMAQITSSQLNLFVDHISQDVLSGQFAEVHRKCQTFAREGPLRDLNVQLADGQILCAFTSAPPSAGEPRARGYIYFDEERRHPAATVAIVPREIGLTEFIPSALTWSVGLALCSALGLGLLIYLLLSVTFRGLSLALKRVTASEEITPELLAALDAPLARPNPLRSQEEINALLQYKRLAHTIISQQERLAEAKQNLARADLAAQVSHDIRSPLSVLNMILPLSPGIPDEHRKLMISATERIDSIANDLLSKGRALAPIVEAPADLAAVLDNVLREKRVQFRERTDLRFTSALTVPRDWRGPLSPSDLARIVSNLINNSVEAIAGPGEIKLSAHIEAHAMAIEISDTGQGIPARLIPALGTQRGLSHGKALRTDSGTGLGLFHARQTLAKSGGQMEITSIEGQGTRITIRVPESVPGSIPGRA